MNMISAVACRPISQGRAALGPAHPPAMTSQDGVSLSPEAEEMMGSHEEEQGLFRQLSQVIEQGDTQQAHDIIGMLQGMCASAPPDAGINDPGSLFDSLNNSVVAGNSSTAQSTIKQIETAMHL